MIKLRAIARRLLYEYPWVVPFACLLSLGGLLVLVYRSAEWFITLSAVVVFGVASFLWGYSRHALKFIRYPSLSNLHRRNYAEVWDTLAASSKEARAAACGHHVETAILDSAASPLRNILELAIVHPSDDVLEIGCGVGRIGLALAPHCRSWTGVDISEKMLAEAHNRLRDTPNFRLLKLARVGLQELASGAFDVVYATNMFDHLDEIDRWIYVRDAFRILRPGGRVYVDTMDIESERGWSAFAAGAELLADFERPAFQPRPTTGAELATYARRAGFSEVRTHARESLVIMTAQKPP